MLCMAADWVHLKLLLYAIGSGNIGKDNVKHLHSQWRTHMRSFGAPLGAPLLPPPPPPLGLSAGLEHCLDQTYTSTEPGCGAVGARARRFG